MLPTTRIVVFCFLILWSTSQGQNNSTQNNQMNNITSNNSTNGTNTPDPSKIIYLGCAIPPETPYINGLSVMNLTIQYINSINFLPNGYKFGLLASNASTKGQSSFAVRSMVAKGAIGIVGPWNSVQALIAAETASILKTPMISPSAGNQELSDYKTFPYFIREANDFVKHANGIVQTIVFFKIKTVALICSRDLDDLVEFVYNDLILNNVTVISLLYVTPSEYELVISLTQKTGVRAIVLLLPSYELAPYTDKAKELGYYGEPWIYFLAQSQLNTIITVANGSIYNGSFGLSFDSKPNATAPMAIAFTQTMAKGLRLPTRVVDPMTWDSVFTFAYAVRNLLLAGTPASKIRNKLFFNAIVNVSFIGASGPVSYNQFGSRTKHRIVASNAYRNESVNMTTFPSGLMLKSVIQIDGNVTTYLLPPTFPDGSSNISDTTPKLPIEYYDCSTRDFATDPLGEIQFDDGIIEPDKYCDEVYDCDNLSDEDSRCDPSLKIAHITLLSLAGVL
eukprot:TRINITY_DN16084_c0_g1_i1.p1 TRINITY_DN16084_c0_g1~~TRINITY_DN16084_c0_g1_i1.p1  ORF type:complete len:507 (-),score=58.00 TRINITY_DN16084_c0_g1_i1:151-1671(-)